MYEVISERPIVEILCFISFRNINSGIKFAIFWGGKNNICFKAAAFTYKTSLSDRLSTKKRQYLRGYLISLS